VLNPSQSDEIVQSVSNSNGSVLAYVCAFCTQSDRNSWFGIPKERLVNIPHYGEIEKLEDMFANRDLNVAVKNGKVCTTRIGNSVKVKWTYTEIPSKIIITTEPQKRKLKFFSAARIQAHYTGSCTETCPVCNDVFSPCDEQDKVLRKLGREYAMKENNDKTNSRPNVFVSVGEFPMKASIEKLPEYESISPDTQKFFPDNHSDTQEYLDKMEQRLEEFYTPPNKKMKSDFI